MDQLDQAIIKASQSKEDLDITNLNDIKFIKRGSTAARCYTAMMNYSTIMIKNVMIYDKTGENIRKYSLNKRGRIKGKLKVINRDNGLYIIIQPDTDLELLQHYLEQDYEEITIECKNNYIPPIFNNVIATRLILVKPILEYNFLASIPCYEVAIVSLESNVISLEPLKCKKLYLHSKKMTKIPSMPESVMAVSLNVTFNETILFKTNTSNIERLCLSSSNENGHIVLSGLSSLTELDIDTDAIVPVHILRNLTRLDLTGGYYNNIIFHEQDDNVVITYIYNAGYTGHSKNTVTSELPNLLVLNGHVCDDRIYSLMPNLKELYIYTMIDDPQYISEKLEKFVMSVHHCDIDKSKKLQNRLLQMKSIRYMTLYLPKSESMNYIIRPDIYYTVYIICYDKQTYHCSEDDINIPQLNEVLSSNRRFLTKERDLLSYL